MLPFKYIALFATIKKKSSMFFIVARILSSAPTPTPTSLMGQYPKFLIAHGCRISHLFIFKLLFWVSFILPHPQMLNQYNKTLTQEAH